MRGEQGLEKARHGMSSQVGRNVTDAQAAPRVAVVVEARQFCRCCARDGGVAPGAVQREQFGRIAAFVMRQDLEQRESRPCDEGLWINLRCRSPSFLGFAVAPKISVGTAQQFVCAELARVETDRSLEYRYSLTGNRPDKRIAVPHPGFGILRIDRRRALEFACRVSLIPGVEQ